MTSTPTQTSTPTPLLLLEKSVNKKNAQVGETLTYALVYRNAGYSTASPVTLVDQLPVTTKAAYKLGSAEGQGIFDATANTLTWNIPLLVPGEAVTVHYSLVLPSWSNDGSSRVDNSAVLSCSTGETVASASVSVSGSVLVQFAVFNEAGEKVQALANFWSSTAVTDFTLDNDKLISQGDRIDIFYKGFPLTSWEGVDSKGQFVNNGSYYIKMDVVDPYGVDNSVVKCVTVSLTQRWVKATVYNDVGEAVRFFNPDEVRQTLAGSGEVQTQDMKLGDVKLAPTVISPSYSNPSAVDGSAVLTFPSGAKLPWDGRNSRNEIVSNGHYRIELDSKGDGIPEQTMIFSVDVLHGDLTPNGRIVLAPNPIHLSRNSHPVFLVGRMGPAVDRTDVRLFTLTGTFVQVLSSDAGDPTRVAWPMASDGGRVYAPGMYLAVVEQRAGEGVLNRTILKVLIQP
jgi:uncharacterized repeat protein (TIGR01451 family)